MDKKTGNDNKLKIEIAVKAAVVAFLFLLGFWEPVQTAYLAVAFLAMSNPIMPMLLILLYAFFWYAPFFRYENYNTKSAFIRSLFATTVTMIVLYYFIMKL